ncbi:AbrB/MazE/SpoVT family DNA-binding domain-containing protein [Saccharothrix sp. ALI-22-I]|uniref:AbrB/MazE/SpoVT family DNA-binding domain-containing protein n=1 Tax=Saccharothrix sp. ALI-22-I TaxID=1933778 RepID=UPI0015C369C7|nr:AbrB/MazE/SpoVT family DNA-binding domain-containing protein [Saccharothrix sp. ALI-22-I]
MGDRQLIAALGWQSEDAYDLAVSADGLLVSLDPAGPFRINIRGHVFIPAATRRVLCVKAGDSLVLLARPEHGTLAVHPTSMVTALLARHHTAPAASRDH